MSKFLLKSDITYRADTEEEANQLIEEMKQEDGFELMSFTSTKKTTKDDEYYVVKFKQRFNDEKVPV